MTAIIEATSTITTLVGDVFGMITANPLLCVYCAGGLICTGIGIFGYLKRRSR